MKAINRFKISRFTDYIVIQFGMSTSDNEEDMGETVEEFVVPITVVAKLAMNLFKMVINATVDLTTFFTNLQKPMADLNSLSVEAERTSLLAPVLSIDLALGDPLVARLAWLSGIQDNWDADGAQKPAAAALERTRSTLRWARGAGLSVGDIDADVLGGVAVYIRGPENAHRLAWVAIMNDADDCVVMSDNDSSAWRGPFNDEAKTRIVTFLREGQQ